MDWEVIGMMSIMITGILTVGGVLLFRPLTKRLGDLLELRVKQARGEIENPKLDRIEALLESMASRMALLEERQDFSDQLLRRRGDEARELPSGEKNSWE